MMIQLNQFKTSLKLERKAVLSLLIFPLFVCLQSRKTKNCKQTLTSDTYEPYTCYTKNSHVSFITLFFYYLLRDKIRELTATMVIKQFVGYYQHIGYHQLKETQFYLLEPRQPVRKLTMRRKLFGQMFKSWRFFVWFYGPILTFRLCLANVG